MRLKIIPRANRDIVNIRSYISTESPKEAEAVTARLVASLKLITTRPEIGRPSLDPRIREWSVPGLPYLIPYRVRGDVVEILRVFHTSQQRPSKWIG